MREMKETCDITGTTDALEFFYLSYPSTKSMIYVRATRPSSSHYRYLTPLNGSSLYLAVEG
jgi:hypothetical protein